MSRRKFHHPVSFVKLLFGSGFTKTISFLQKWS